MFQEQSENSIPPWNRWIFWKRFKTVFLETHIFFPLVLTHWGSGIIKSCGFTINLPLQDMPKIVIESWNCSFTFTALLISIDPSAFSESIVQFAIAQNALSPANLFHSLELSSRHCASFSKTLISHSGANSFSNEPNVATHNSAPIRYVCFLLHLLLIISPSL